MSGLRSRARLIGRPFHRYQASYTIGPNSIGGSILLPRDRLFGVPKLLKPIGLSGQSYYLASLPILVHLVKELRLAAVLKLAIFYRLANLSIDWGRLSNFPSDTSQPSRGSMRRLLGRAAALYRHGRLVAPPIFPSLRIQVASVTPSVLFEDTLLGSAVGAPVLRTSLTDPPVRGRRVAEARWAPLAKLISLGLGLGLWWGNPNPNPNLGKTYAAMSGYPLRIVYQARP